MSRLTLLLLLCSAPALYAGRLASIGTAESDSRALSLCAAGGEHICVTTGPLAFVMFPDSASEYGFTPEPIALGPDLSRQFQQQDLEALFSDPRATSLFSEINAVDDELPDPWLFQTLTYSTVDTSAQRVPQAKGDC